jgi:cation:H+ antiporter
MLHLLLIWLQFLGLAAVAVAGFHLCLEGDRIGVKLGITGSWVGLAGETHAIDLPRALRRFGFAAAVVVAAGCWLPFVGSDLAEVMGWNRVFVGTAFIAAVTSMPELAIKVFVLRMGSVDMAIGNLLGSNLFNIAIVAIDDLVYTQGPLLANVAPVHAATAFSAVIMPGLAIIGLLYRPRGLVLRSIGWVSIGLAVLYLFNTCAVLLYGE